MATGFRWNQPHGAVISGQFSQPVKAAEVVIYESGHEDSDHFSRDVARAIVGKLGNISGMDTAGLLDWAR